MDLRQVVVLATLLVSVHSAKCPNGFSTERKCTSSKQCGSGQRCYRDVEGGNENEGFCCGDLGTFCAATGLHTFQLSKDDIYSYKWGEMLQKTHYVDPTTNVACPFPYSYTTSEFSQDLPVGFSKDSTEPLKTCSKNADCEEGDYCGEATNPSFSTGVDNSNGGRKFCYRKPAYLEYLKLAKSSSGIVACSSNSECTDSFCFIFGHGMKVRTPLEHDGICVTESNDMCPLNIKTKKNEKESVSEPQFCSTGGECTLPSEYSKDEYETTCVPVHSKLPDKKICCIVPKSCTYGNVVSPMKSCKKTEECSRNGQSWCDPTGVCCGAKDESFSKCPDGITPLFNEPACENVIPANEMSGECMHNANALCLRGHCCPTTKVKEGKAELGETTYHSFIQCDTEDVHFVSFCYLNRVAVIGKDAIETDQEQICTTNLECSSDESRKCVKVDFSHPICVKNTLKTEEPAFGFPISILVGCIIVALVAFCIMISCILKICKKEGKFEDVISNRVSQNAIIQNNGQHEADKIPVIEKKQCKFGAR